MSIRNRLDEAMASNSAMTYRKLSLKAGMSDSMVHKYMTGATQNMSTDKLITIAEILNVDPRWLIFGDTTPPNGVINLWDRIAEADKPRAIAILEAFVSNQK
jgi:transcriptional regulator with XRE-family HTH domain